VIVYRLISANTIEAQILAKAASKRKLEKLVIQKGKFKSLAAAAASGDSVAELADLLTREDSQKIIAKGGDKIFSDEEMAALLDRSEEAYEKAEGGAGKAGRFEIVEEKGEEDPFATRV
jgi:ATP-dependent DNA helicase